MREAGRLWADSSQEETRVRERARRGVGWMRGCRQSRAGKAELREREWEAVASIFILLPRQAPGGLGAPSSWPRPLSLVSKVPLSEPCLLRPKVPPPGPAPPPRWAFLVAPPLQIQAWPLWPRPQTAACPRSPALLSETLLAPASRFRPPTQQLLGRDQVLTPLPTYPVSVPAHLTSPIMPFQTPSIFLPCLPLVTR